MEYGLNMYRWMVSALLAGLMIPNGVAGQAVSGDANQREDVPKVFVLPIREDVMPPLVYLVRRGVKAAMEAEAELLVLDMETNGGRLDSTEEIIVILNKFAGRTVTYVNRDAYSAGAFIAVATEEIYMAPQAVIGAAAPIMLSPGGGGVQDMPDTMEAKMTSAVAARVRANAEKNGHNKEVVEAMINRTKELIIDGEVLNKEGQILTLTNREAEREYGDPPRRLLSAGTVEDLDSLLDLLGFAGAQVERVEPTGAERLGFWLNAISPILLLIGIVGIYIEFKTPGFGLPGVVGVIAFALYFLGGHAAGLSGMEWLALFVLGLVLVGLELFAFPGTIILGAAGGLLMFAALLMAMVDVYPGPPALPSFSDLSFPLRQMSLAFLGALVVIYILGKILPKTSAYGVLVSSTASAMASTAALAEKQKQSIGMVGTTISPLRPGGKAQFGERIMDVVAQGEMIERGERVKIVGYSGSDPIVESDG